MTRLYWSIAVQVKDFDFVGLFDFSRSMLLVPVARYSRVASRESPSVICLFERPQISEATLYYIFSTCGKAVWD
jgi:hypothetical protein